MARQKSESRGEALVKRLRQGRHTVERAPRAGARELPVLRGVDSKCLFSQSTENVLSAASDILLASKRVFRYGNTIVLEVAADDGGLTIWPLAIASSIQANAASLMANVFVCETRSQSLDAPPTQFAPPTRFVELLLNNEPTRARLPTIRVYATRPIFDEQFNFLPPGWHADVGYLIHGPEVEPLVPKLATASTSVLDQLPRRLSELLRDFCWRSEADLVNAVGALLTGMLAALFVRLGKPLILLDGNQPGVGKTLLARVTGILLDGADPDAIQYCSEDEELAKRLCATLRGKPTSIVLIDNAKTKSGREISSTAIEANSTAPRITLRLLGQSVNYSRPNDLLWFLTMNVTKATGDIVSRGLPIQFHFDGNPKNRSFHGRDPLMFALDHRAEILGELAGLVIRWTQQGRPRGHQGHRLTHWAEVIGGILDANGLLGFLTNVSVAALEFNSSLDELAAVAEAALEMSSEIVTDQTSERVSGLTARDFEPIFRRGKVLVDRLDGTKSKQGRSTLIGNFLTPLIDSQVPIESGGRKGTAILRCQSGRSKAKLYHLYIALDQVADLPGEMPANSLPSPTIGRGAPSTPANEHTDVSPANSPPEAAAGADGPGDGSPPSGALGNDESW